MSSDVRMCVCVCLTCKHACVRERNYACVCVCAWKLPPTVNKNCRRLPGTLVIKRSCSALKGWIFKIIYSSFGAAWVFPRSPRNIRGAPARETSRNKENETRTQYDNRSNIITNRSKRNISKMQQKPRHSVEKPIP